MGAINPRDRQRERAEVDAIQSRLAVRFERRLRREISRTMIEAADGYEQRGELAIAPAIYDHSETMAGILAADYRAAALALGNRLFSDAKALDSTLIRKQGLIDLLAAAVEQFVRTWVASRILRINRTTESQIREIIDQGLDEGLSVPNIARRIQSIAPTISALRAHVIARTETHTAAGFGAQQAAELTGLDMRREWVSAEDERTRTDPPDAFDHDAANAQIVGMHEPFIVSGEELMFPGDPNGSAGNIIMCRCAVIYIA